MSTNGHPDQVRRQPRVPAAGVWCPAVTFFDPDTDTLDLVSQKKYFSYLARSGLTGLIILGTNAESFLLTREERRALITIAREAVGPDFPLIVGVGAHSTRQVLENLDEAYQLGADYALALPATYFGKATTPTVIENFFNDIGENSLLPIVIYNFPGVCNGVDLESDIITRIAKKNKNIVGVKLTCGSVAKITRLAATFGPQEFAVYAGQADFLIGGLSVGSAGCITAFGNVFPKSVSQVYKLYKAGKIEEALQLHRKAALAEGSCKGGVATTKYAAAMFLAPKAGIENAEEKLRPRRPYEPPSEAIKKTVRDGLGEMDKIESAM